MTTLDPKALEAAAKTLVYVSAANFHERGSGVAFLPNDAARAAAEGVITAYLDALSSIPAQPVGIVTGTDNDMSWYAGDDLAIGTELFTSRAPSHPAAVAVTDEMVEAFKAEHAKLMLENLSYDETLKLALEAALVDRDRVKL